MKNAASSNVNAIELECYSTNLVLLGTASARKCDCSLSTLLSPLSEAHQDIDHWTTAVLLDSSVRFSWLC